MSTARVRRRGVVLLVIGAQVLVAVALFVYVVFPVMDALGLVEQRIDVTVPSGT